MSPELGFRIANAVAVVGWILLAVWPYRRPVATLVTAVVLPSLLALAYTALVIARFGTGHGDFLSLAGLSTLFADPWVLLTGWVHYLAFDLFVGSWEARDAAARGIPQGLLVPCLALTFLFGPMGLLSYLALRFARTGAVAVT